MPMNATVLSEQQRDALSPNGLERMLAAASLIMLLLESVALWRGRTHLPEIPLPVTLHLATVTVALMVTPALLLMQRGTGRHRLVGWLWALSMMATAIASLFVRQLGQGGFSAIHLLSIVVILSVPKAIWLARSGRIARHRQAVCGIVLGGLVIAGFFTLLPGRMLGGGLFG